MNQIKKNALCTISIVSHGDALPVVQMIDNSASFYFEDNFDIIIRENRDSYSSDLDKLSEKFSNVTVVYNSGTHGFGENHNLNFSMRSPGSEFFIVCNPDLVQLPERLNLLDYSSDKWHLSTPNIFDIDGTVSDFKRSDINFQTLIKRFFFNNSSGVAKTNDDLLWVPSIFTIFSAELFDMLDGYDSRIFMYYEDYDICMRARRYTSLKILDSVVLHEGRRASRTNLSLLFAHLKSVIYVMKKARKGMYHED